MKRSCGSNRSFCLLISVVLCCACATRPTDTSGKFKLRSGDLLFQDQDGGPLCDAIEKVTQGTDGAQFSHVGIVEVAAGGKVMVIEAISEGVVLTPLDTFLERSRDAHNNPKVLVGRLKTSDRHLIPAALRVAHSLLGRPYDSAFAIDNESFYCSELVYEAFRQANSEVPVFVLEPMTFKDPSTGATFPAWTEYYKALSAPIPEGEPGLNPGSISRSPSIRIVHAYGVPSGWEGSR